MKPKIFFSIALAMLVVSFVICHIASDKVPSRTDQQIVKGKLTGLEEISLPLLTDKENQIISVNEKLLLETDQQVPVDSSVKINSAEKSIAQPEISVQETPKASNETQENKTAMSSPIENNKTDQSGSQEKAGQVISGVISSETEPQFLQKETENKTAAETQVQAGVNTDSKNNTKKFSGQEPNGKTSQELADKQGKKDASDNNPQKNEKINAEKESVVQNSKSKAAAASNTVEKDMPKKENITQQNSKGKITSMKFEFSGNTLILRLVGDRNMVGKCSKLKSPDRVILDIAGVWNIKSIPVPSNALVSGLRIGMHPNYTRLALDLKKPVKAVLVPKSKISLELHIK